MAGREGTRASSRPPPPSRPHPSAAVRRLGGGGGGVGCEVRHGAGAAGAAHEADAPVAPPRPPSTAEAGFDPLRARARCAAACPRPVVRQAAVQALSVLRGELVAAVAAPVICEGVVAVRVLREAKVAAERAIEGRGTMER